MARFGTVVNGVVVIDGPPPPDGTRLRLEPADAADDLWDEPDIGPPPDTETREEFLQSLRQSIAEVDAGERGVPLSEAFDQIRRELDLPPSEPVIRVGTAR